MTFAQIMESKEWRAHISQWDAYPYAHKADEPCVYGEKCAEMAESIKPHIRRLWPDIDAEVA